MKFLRLYAAMALCFVALASRPALSERSPIFGTATIEAISADAARDITARGELANFYGNLAISHAYHAYIFAFYARHFAAPNSAQEQSWYATAAWYGWTTYLFASWAQGYSSAGM
jgi:hypothetical protein